jgi:hypothetical protein
MGTESDKKNLLRFPEIGMEFFFEKDKANNFY